MMALVLYFILLCFVIAQKFVLLMRDRKVDPGVREVRRESGESEE